MKPKRLPIGFLIALCIGIILSGIGLYANIGKIYPNTIPRINSFLIGFFVLQCIYFTIFILALLLIIIFLVEIRNKEAVITNFEKIGLLLLAINFITIILGLLNILPQIINTFLVWVTPEIFSILLLVFGSISYSKSKSKLSISFILWGIVFFFWIPALMFLGTLYFGV